MLKLIITASALAITAPVAAQDSDGLTPTDPTMQTDPVTQEPIDPTVPPTTTMDQSTTEQTVTEDSTDDGMTEPTMETETMPAQDDIDEGKGYDAAPQMDMAEEPAAMPATEDGSYDAGEDEAEPDSIR